MAEAMRSRKRGRAKGILPPAKRSTGAPHRVGPRSRPRNERGYALLETALSLVLLLTLVFGVMQVGLALYAYHFISDAAREGTRYAIVRGSACNTFASACPASGPDVQNYVQTLGFPGINPNKMTVTTAWPSSGTSCTPSATPCNNPGNLVQVTVNYQLLFALPFVQVNTLTLTSTSQMVISQ